ncbi:hypothetical protein SAMN05443252_103235 [Bacillus sp. OV322]|uniref:hypothetical protein n=1 Tax=Bacillus sp. OV322 TaxID=1882764 RepID=UPI0008EC1518|nr:hypothetical protein [Bacillus sp. OV322]SFC40194.1 hypothetical protein SAMN05443252_103235 [Bacillus sp. OV322]
MKKTALFLSIAAFLGAGSYLIYGVNEHDQPSPKENAAKKSDISTWVYHTKVPEDYIWKIHFDHGLNKNILSDETAYVLDNENKHVPVRLQSGDSGTLTIKPPKEGYKKGITYNLYTDRDLDKEFIGDEKQPKLYRIQFTVSKSGA